MRPVLIQGWFKYFSLIIMIASPVTSKVPLQVLARLFLHPLSLLTTITTRFHL